MNKINKTSENLKKKMSFQDYSKPNSAAKKEHDSKTACQLDVQASKLCTPSLKEDAVVDKLSTVAPKKKVTFYLDSLSEDLLTDIFINRLKSRNKSDKSSLICEAIQLLHKMEKNER